MNKAYLAALAALFFAANADAQTVLNYWDFTTNADVVGGVDTSDVGTPDLSVHPTYGEAYAGSGNSLNITFNVQSFLIADTHDGVNPTALDFGMNDFAFSYWSYDEANDGNTRGPRILDCLAGTTTGIQLGTNAAGTYNLRIDTADGGASISNNTLGALVQPSGQWVHVVVNVDRNAGQYEIFYDGASQGVVPMSAPSAGGIFPTKDMDIGVINSEGAGNQSENCGLDDLAFYDALLSATDISGLAGGTLTPADFVPPSGPDFCFGDGSGAACPCGNSGPAGAGCANATGAGAVITTNADVSVMSNNLTFDISGGTLSTFAVLVSGDNALGGGLGIVGLPAKDGLRCVGGNLLRHGTRALDATGANTDPWGSLTGPNGGIIGGAGFAAGQTRYFQARYREDPMAGQCGTDQNTSQGLELTFVL